MMNSESEINFNKNIIVIVKLSGQSHRLNVVNGWFDHSTSNNAVVI